MAEEEEEPKKPNYGKRNRAAGHNWELVVVKKLKLIGYPEVATSRAVSKLRDAQKVDICNTDESLYGRLPYNIQAKTYSSSVGYAKLLASMPKGKEINVVFLKQTALDKKRFLETGTYAILSLDDFYKMMEQITVLQGIKLDKAS